MKKVICFITIITFMFFGGCVEKNVSVSKEEKEKNYIIYNMGKAPEDLIMLQNSYNIREQDLISNVFQGLIGMDDKGKIIPELAESWTVSEDELSYKFKIRENAKWSNGIEINAEDFVKFFQAILNKDIKNFYASQLFCIYGAEDYNKGRCDFKNVAITAIDKKNLQIKLNYPCIYLLSILSEPIYGIRNINEDLLNWKKQYKNILYSGNFIIDEITDKNEIVIKKNNNNWNEKSIKSDKIVVSCIESSEAAMAAFDNNKIDAFKNPPIFECDKLVKENKLQDFSSFKYGTLVFNLKKDNIICDLNLRKALSLSVDRSYMVKDILNDTCKVANAYVPNNISDGTNGVYLNKNFFKDSLDKDTAIGLFNKSKFDKQKDTLKLIYEDSIENRKICEGISKKVKETLNIKIQCEGYLKEQFYEELKKDDYQIAKIDFYGDYDYPLAFLDKYNEISNFYGYKNIQLENFIIKSKIDKDKAKKIEALRACENILAEEIPYIPLYFNKTIICKKDNIVGIYCTKRGNVKLDRAYISYIK